MIAHADHNAKVNGWNAVNVWAAFRARFMRERPDWNARGPHVPAWFLERIHEFDPSVVLQYMPPHTIDKDGVDPAIYPQGLWVICRRLPGTRMLFKRWMYALRDDHGRPARPDMHLLKMLRLAHNLWRRGQGSRMEEYFDKTIKRTLKEKRRRSREELLSVLAAMMRRAGMTNYPNRPRVFFPATASG